MRLSKLIILHSAVAFLFSQQAFSQEAVVKKEEAVVPQEQEKSFPAFSFHGRYFLHYNYTEEFPLDETGFKDGLKTVIDHRLRIKPKAEFSENFLIFSEADLITGQLAGDTTDVGSDALLLPRDDYYGRKKVEFRQLYLQWKSDFGLLRAGQMTSQWGLGVMSNSGEDKEDEFYDTRMGDLVDRIIFVSKPLKAFSDSEFADSFYLALGGDVVYRDDNANLLGGDLAYEGVLSMFYDKAGLFAGAYFAYRNQKDDNGDKLWALASDIFAKYRLNLSGDVDLNLALEGVFLYGWTDRAQFERAKDGLDILAYGFVGRAGLDLKKINFTAGLELGFASGDGDTGDDTMRTFTFDYDYKVGMILFEEVLGRMTARSTDRVSDPNLVGKPIKGYELAASDGTVSNAIYLYPRIKYSPLKNLTLTGAFLWARAVAPVADPYNSSVNGGYPAAFFGSKSGRKELGYEVNFGASYGIPIADLVTIRFAAQGGVFMPSNVFNDANGNKMDEVYKVRFLTDILW
ncbi:MAG: hypothetical protein FJ088_08000 [Deltaproteobacteria bacterium]|nr:hypothetical protein [Deltaproteobacteria bacterium]